MINSLKKSENLKKSLRDYKENENRKKQLTFSLKSNIIYRISLH